MEEIYDPLRKKLVAATPEEGVRQWFITKVLGESLGVPAHMMNSEVSFQWGQKPYRADILVFGKDQQPLAIVECKRPDVELTATICEQLQRYNAALNVKFLFLTNGRKTFAFARRQDGGFGVIDILPTYTEMTK